MRDTTQEKVGDIILGAPFVNCHHDTRFDKKGVLRLVRSPLLLGAGNDMHWTRKETRPGGWHREVKEVLATASCDPTRATAQFQVVSVKKVPPSDPGFTGRDAGYGGGTTITVKRLDGNGERIQYTRGCSFNTDLNVPVTVLS